MKVKTSVVEDTKRFAKKFPPMAELWTLEENLKIEMAIKEINNCEKQMKILMRRTERWGIWSKAIILLTQMTILEA